MGPLGGALTDAPDCSNCASDGMSFVLPVAAHSGDTNLQPSSQSLPFRLPGKATSEPAIAHLSISAGSEPCTHMLNTGIATRLAQ